MKVNFYQDKSINIDLVISTILFNIVKLKQNKVFLYSENIEFLNRISRNLWNFGRNKIIPHLLDFEIDLEQEIDAENWMVEQQIVYISNKKTNLSKANYLMIFENLDSIIFDDFVKSFELVLIPVFASNIKESTEIFEKLKSTYDTNLFVKNLANSKWVSENKF